MVCLILSRARSAQSTDRVKQKITSNFIVHTIYFDEYAPGEVDYGTYEVN